MLLDHTSHLKCVCYTPFDYQKTKLVEYYYLSLVTILLLFISERDPLMRSPGSSVMAGVDATRNQYHPIIQAIGIQQKDCYLSLMISLLLQQLCVWDVWYFN